MGFFGVLGLGFRVLGFGLWVLGLGFKGLGGPRRSLGLRTGLGFRVYVKLPKLLVCRVPIKLY